MAHDLSPKDKSRTLLLFHSDPTMWHSYLGMLDQFGTAEIVEQTTDLIDRATLLVPDVIVLKLTEESLEVVSLLISAYPQLQVIGLVHEMEMGIIRKAMHAGIHDILDDPPEVTELVESIRNLVQRRDPGGAPVRGFLVAVISSKGGIGTTTIALNLTALLSAEGKAALLDADAPGFGTASTMIATKGTTLGTVASLLQQGFPPQPAVFHRVAMAHDVGITTLSLWESQRDVEPVSQHISSLLDVLTSSYPLLIVDAGRPVHEVQHRILQRADIVLTLTTLEISALRNLRWLWDLLGELGVADKKVLSVLSRFQKTMELSQRDAENALKRRFDAVLPETSELARIADNGAIAVKIRPDLPWCQRVGSLGELILARRRELLRAVLT